MGVDCPLRREIQAGCSLGWEKLTLKELGGRYLSQRHRTTGPTRQIPSCIDERRGRGSTKAQALLRSALPRGSLAIVTPQEGRVLPCLPLSIDIPWCTASAAGPFGRTSREPVFDLFEPMSHGIVLVSDERPFARRTRPSVLQAAGRDPQASDAGAAPRPQ